MSDRKNLYVIGGRPRTGKGTIAQRVKERHGSLVVLGTDDFRPRDNEQLDERAWCNIVEHLKSSKFTTDVLIEGVAITPTEIHDLSLESLDLRRVVFLGYSRASHAETILAAARQTGNDDWVMRELERDPAYEQTVKAWMPDNIRVSAGTKRAADEFGYGYFDITDYPVFEDYLEKVTRYLLEPHQEQR